MTSLSLNNLREQVIEAGVVFTPADTVFYTDFPYKIELSPKFRGLGGVAGKRACTIQITNPVKARAKLAEFNDRMEKTISNVEYRQEICEFVAGLPNIQYKTRMGGENNLFYFRDPAMVMLVVERYKAVINCVTGPVNSAHALAIDKETIVMRQQLYFNKFRYYIEFDRTQEFVDDCLPQVEEFLSNAAKGTSRHRGIHQLQVYYNPGTVWFSHRRMYPPKTVVVYLTDPNDYVYLKLMAGHHVEHNHEVRLFDELNND